LPEVNRRKIEQFLKCLDSTHLWLDEQFGGENLTDRQARLISTLRRYLNQCGKRAAEGSLSRYQIDVKRRKIEEACVTLWMSRRRSG
jgi:hypothetical protein